MEITADIARRAMATLARRAQEKRYQRQPETWYVERFGGKATDLDWSLHPEYEKHEWDGTPNPFLLAIRSLANWKNIAIESATSTGKTFIAARIAYWFLDCFPSALVITTAPKEKQLKSVLWSEIEACFPKFKKVRPGAEMFNLRVFPDGSKVKFMDAADSEALDKMSQMLGVVSGVRAGEESATKMQGFHAKYMLFIVEEAAGIPAAVMTAIKNTCTGDFNVIMGIGNPDSVTDALHQFSELQHVTSIRISGYDHPNIVTGRTLIHGAVSQKSIDIRKAEYGVDSNLFRSRVRGIAPQQSADSLIMLQWVYNCAVNHTDYIGVPDDHLSYNALGVDVANSTNGDSACLAWGQGAELISIHEFSCPNATHLAYNLFMRSEDLAVRNYRDYHTRKIQDYKILGERIGIDAVGIGVATVNAMLDSNYQVMPLQGGSDEDALPKDFEEKPLYKFRTLRTQMWFQARLDLENGRVRLNIPLIDLYKLGKELTMPTYKVSDGCIVLEKKEEVRKKLGKSPNMADAFVYWNWMRKKRIVGNGAINLPIGNFSADEKASNDFVPPSESWNDDFE